MTIETKAERREKRKQSKPSAPKEPAYKPSLIAPMNANQRKYIQSLQNEPVTVAIGPAGTGKTFIAAAYALDLLMENHIDRIIISRPAVAVEDEQFGFLPGNLLEKFGPWCAPIFSVFIERLGSKAKLEQLIRQEKIIIKPLAFLQGESFRRDFLLLDEAENCTPRQMKMVLTRFGKETRGSISGDLNQIMRTDGKESGLKVLCDVITASLLALPLVQFTKSDVVRSPLARQAAEAFEQRGY